MLKSFHVACELVTFFLRAQEACGRLGHEKEQKIKGGGGGLGEGSRFLPPLHPPTPPFPFFTHVLPQVALDEQK